MAVVEISVFKNEMGKYYYELKPSLKTVLLSLIAVGVEEVSGTYGPYDSSSAAEVAATTKGNWLAYYRKVEIHYRF